MGSPTVGDQVNHEREATHGNYAHSCCVSQRFKQVLRGALGSRVLPDSHQEAAEMILFKLSRIASGNPNHIDHWRDIAGYATLVVRELEKK